MLRHPLYRQNMPCKTKNRAFDYKYFAEIAATSGKIRKALKAELKKEPEKEAEE